jgi:hypothetical protein
MNVVGNYYIQLNFIFLNLILMQYCNWFFVYSPEITIERGFGFRLGFGQVERDLKTGFKTGFHVL